ncbi:Uncharacterised protein [Klebsiella pneumoniae]|nr:Uncharacterised protein [Klebsiella pneumoniae]
MQALKYRQLLAQRRFRSRQVVHKEPRRQSENNQERHPDPRGVFQIQHRAVRLLATVTAKNGKDRDRDHQRRDQLHHADAHIAKSAVNAERPALLRFREEEADVGHTGGKVGSGEAAQQRDNHEDAKRRRGILDREAQPDAWHNHDPGAERRPATAAEQRHHKGVRHA